MTGVLARLRPEPSDDEGNSLIEMIVVIVIFGIIGAMMSTWFISSTKSSARSVSRTDDLLSAQQAMDRLTRDIRLSIPISVGNPNVITGSSGNDLTMYSNVGSDLAPRLVHWYVSNGTLIRSEVKGVKTGGVWSWPAATAIDTITKGVVNDGNPDIFQYLDSTADNVTGLCTDLPKPTPCATPLASDPLSTTDLPKVTSIEVTLRVGTRSVSSGGPLWLRTRVYMQNAGLTASFK